MTEIVSKIMKFRKEVIAKMDRINILLLLSPNEELSQSMAYVTDIYASMLEFAEGNLDNEEASVINRLTNDVETVNNILNDIKEDISSNFKLVSLLFLESLKGEILVYFYEKLSDILDNVGSINNILEYINQNKANEVRCFLDQVINYIKIYATEKDYHLLPLNYLENVNCEETFNTKKWTELYNNVRFTLKYINCPNVVDEEKIKEAFWEFELYYYISITIDM
jgi:hypothetical protein